MGHEDADKRVRQVMSIAPNEWDQGPLVLAHEIREFLKSVVDEGTNIDSGGGDGTADLWPKVGGVEYFISIRRSNKQTGKYKCPTCSDGEIAPQVECPDCDGTGWCVRSPQN